MKLRPFLSHKRQDEDHVRQLQHQLALRGAGGWRDTDDLRIGDHTPTGVRRAIRSETHGFIWFGTPRILDSAFVNGIEIPEALARKVSESSYPIVPLFAELAPGDSLEARLAARLGEKQAGLFLNCNGITRENGEELEVFLARAARRYLRDGAQRLGDRPVTAAITSLREPAGDHDLTFDWRSLLDPRRRTLVPGAQHTMERVLVETTEALQACSSEPQVELSLDLPLPMAFLVGYEWRIATRMRLAVRQRTGGDHVTITGTGPTSRAWLDPVVEEHNDRGPVVLAVSASTDLGRAADRYAQEVAARRLVRLHAPALLNADELRGLAREVARILKDLNNEGVEKHLLLLGPGALALLAGAAANATGITTIPLWDGSRFSSSLVIGAV